MIVVDSSILIAITRNEPEGLVFEDILDSAVGALISIVSYVETHVVIAGRKANVDIGRTERWFQAFRIEIVPVSAEQGALAVNAFLNYGKGRHPARLNFADCFTYALAKSRNLPLFFKGDDFSRTDITPAWRPGEHE